MLLHNPVGENLRTPQKSHKKSHKSLKKNIKQSFSQLISISFVSEQNTLHIIATHFSKKAFPQSRST